MRYQRVLLIIPRYSGSHYRPALSTGVGYIAENLYRSGVEYSIVDMGLERGLKRLKSRINQFQPDLIGFSLMSYRYKDHYRLISCLKGLFPSIPIVAGGAHLSMFREQVLDQCLEIDYGVILEGERTLVELCQGKDIQKIPGLIYQNGDSVSYTGEREFIQDLDDVPFPRYEKFPLAKYINKEFNIIPIVTSRGCPYPCTYCPVPQAMGSVFRARSPESIADEIEYWYKKGYRRFGISDDNFSCQRDRVLGFCEEIQRRNLSGLKISCDNGLRADCVDCHLLEKMRHAGFWRIAFGVESGSKKVLNSIKKYPGISFAERAIKDACRVGFVVRLFFLIGSPAETYGDFQESVKLARKYPVSETSFYTLVPFPKTELYSWIKQNDYFVVKGHQEYLNFASGWVNRPIFQTPWFSLKERKKAFKLAQRIDREAVQASFKLRLKKFGLLGKIAARGYGLHRIRRLLDFNIIRKTVSLFMKEMIKEALDSPLVPRVKEYFALSQRPRVSVVIPSFDGYRDGLLSELLLQLKNQTFRDFEARVIKGDCRQGRAINKGARLANGEILVIMDDDVSIGTPYLLENLVKVLENDPSIGMAGVSFGIPGSVRGLQRRALKELPRYTFPIVNRVVESDLASHPCCAIPKHVFEEVGGEKEEILRGLDPELRVRIRRAGYKVVVTPNTWVYHLPPKTLRKLLRKFYRNGKGSAHLQMHYPELVYETHSGRGKFVEKRPFIYRCFRYPYCILRSLLSFRFIAFLSHLSYGAGFIMGCLEYMVWRMGVSMGWWG